MYNLWRVGTSIYPSTWWRHMNLHICTHLWTKHPQNLIISSEKAKSIFQDIAKVRLESSLVLAFVLLLQKDRWLGMTLNSPLYAPRKCSSVEKYVMAICVLTIKFQSQLSSLHDIMACNAAISALQPLSWPGVGVLGRGTILLGYPLELRSLFNGGTWCRGRHLLL
jgi:hypothetical protein